MKPYLNNPMHGMPQMGEMNEMSQMMDIQSMRQMMQSMYHMIQNMYHMMNMQGMHPMMNMQEMCPMMDMQEKCPMMDMQGMHPMMNMQDDMKQFPIPMLVNLEQLSPNQLQISYDRDVDMTLGMKPTNYWVQDMMNARPEGIATLGKNDKVNARNSLTNSTVKINPKNGSAKTFILTFNQVIPRGAAYKLIICYVTVEGAPPYSGDNGMATFIGK